jgi:hypothetical protein
VDIESAYQYRSPSILSTLIDENCWNCPAAHFPAIHKSPLLFFLRSDYGAGSSTRGGFTFYVRSMHPTRPPLKVSMQFPFLRADASGIASGRTSLIDVLGRSARRLWREAFSSEAITRIPYLSVLAISLNLRDTWQSMCLRVGGYNYPIHPSSMPRWIICIEFSLGFSLSISKSQPFERLPFECSILPRRRSKPSRMVIG